MSLFNSLKANNIELDNEDTHIIHSDGSGKFLIDTNSETITVGHTNLDILLKGETYVQGSMSNTGPTGPQGQEGLHGYQVKSGFTGNTGSTAVTGTTGNTGPTGIS